MTYTIDEWDSELQQQVTRPATPEEIAEIETRKASKAVALSNQDIDAKIAALEAKITQRRLREALLGDTSFISNIESQIAALRRQYL